MKVDGFLEEGKLVVFVLEVVLPVVECIILSLRLPWLTARCNIEMGLGRDRSLSRIFLFPPFFPRIQSTRQYLIMVQVSLARQLW